MKRYISLLIATVMVVASFPTVEARAETLDDQAETLIELDLLQGDGNSYGLSDELTRAEGATFVVRMLGVEEDVLDNAEAYEEENTFDDVDSDDWYAPYVGYCIDKGIINGYRDNTFRPQNTLDEQSFLKILLVALGYEYNEDFSWDDVYSQAVDADLIESEDQDLDFTRGEVVDLVYQALTLQNVETGLQMAYALVDDDWSEEDLDELGILDYSQDEEVENITHPEENEFLVELSAVPYAFEPESVEIVDDSGHSLTVEDVDTTSDTTTFEVITSDEESNGLYTVEISNLVDQSGNYFEEYSQQFVALGDEETEDSEDTFGIAKAEQVGAGKVNITFTQPVNEDSLKAKYFSVVDEDEDLISDGADDDVSLYTVDDKTIQVVFEDADFEEDEIYEVYVDSGLVSEYRIHLNGADSAYFVGTDYEYESFQLTDITYLSTQQLKVEFNMTIDTETAEVVGLYELTDEDDDDEVIDIDSVTAVNYQGTGYVLLDLADELEEDDTYNLLIWRMYRPDSDSDAIKEENYEFEAEEEDADDLKIKDVDQLDQQTVRIEVNQDLDEESAEDPDNYRVNKVSSSAYKSPIATYYDSDEDTVTLYFDSDYEFEDRTEYRVLITDDIINAEGMHPEDDASDEFKADEDIEHEDVEVSRATYLGDDVVLVKMSSPIAFDATNISVDNYSLTGFSSDDYDYDDEDADSDELDEELFADSKSNGESVLVNGVIYYDATHILLIVDDYDKDDVYRLDIDTLTEYNGWSTTEDVQARVGLPSED